VGGAGGPANTGAGALLVTTLVGAGGGSQCVVWSLWFCNTDNAPTCVSERQRAHPSVCKLNSRPSSGDYLPRKTLFPLE
jgi:hypothetical protein